MTHWMCTSCGYYLLGLRPPDQCQGCGETCVFNDVTCYRPECGGEKNIDPLLVGATLRVPMGVEAKQPKARLTGTTVEGISVAEIMSGLSEKQRQQVRNLGHVESYEQSTVICTQGAEARNLYLVQEGQVGVQSELPRGIRVLVSVVSSGEAFAWSALVPPYRLTATVVALSKTRVLAIERDTLLALMRADPSLGLVLMRNVASVIASRLRNLEMELVGLVQDSHR